MITFKVGDKINHHMCGMGTVVDISFNCATVAFNKKIFGLTHSCNGKLPDGNGRYFNHDFNCTKNSCASINCLKHQADIYTLWNEMQSQ